jgi:hypothetical protein
MLVDPTGLWEQVAGSENLWKETDNADTFYSLVSKIDGNLAPSKNAMCIRPVPPSDNQELADAMREAWGKVNKQGDVPLPALGGIYDVSSLLQKRNPEAAPVALGVGADTNGYIQAAEEFFHAQHFKSGGELAKELRKISENGAKPIGTLILVGHCYEGAKTIGGRRDGPMGADANFKLGDLTTIAKKAIKRDIIIYDKQNQLAYWPTFDEAVAGILPPVAWLATDAVVYVVGCHTDKFAGAIAARWLRSNQAEAWGTLLNTWAPDGGMGWGKESNSGPDLSLPVSRTPEQYFTVKQDRKTPEVTRKVKVLIPIRGGYKWVEQDRVVRPATSVKVPVWKIHKGVKN